MYFEQIKQQGKALIKSHKNRDQFFERYQKVAPNYLNHVIENTIFLQQEINLLNAIHAQPAFRSHPMIKRRLLYLTKGANRLFFVEQDHKDSDLIKEVYYRQKKPVEIGKEDLKNLLSMIEGVEIDPSRLHVPRPQLIMRRFDLKRTTDLMSESYLLEMDLIKREPI